MEIKTLKELLDIRSAQFASKVAFSMLNGEEVTYGEVANRAKEVQQSLLSAGLRPGDKVALLSSNMPNWGVCYLAVTAAGMTVVPILPDFSGDELEMIIRHSESKALMVSDKLFTKLSKEVIDSLNIVIRTKNLGVISQKVFEPGELGNPQPDDLAAIIYTSGTTSKPKGVMLLHRNICAQFDMIPSLFEMLESDVLLSVLPLSHTYECTLGMLYAFNAGATVVYLDRPPTASVLLPALKRVRPTVMIVVPLLIEKIYKAQILGRFTANAFIRALYSVGIIRKMLHKLAGKKLYKAFGGRLRFFGVGGSKLDADTEKFLMESTIPYAIGYGLTETAPLVAGAVGKMVRLGSTGPVLKGIQIRLENINPETKQGEIVVKTPSAMAGYYKNEETTKEVFTPDGWFKTGDLGFLDEDGWLFIKGRLKNMIVGPSGENIYPEEIESVLNSHVFISDSIVTEQDGRLVALVHFNREELEAKYEEFKEEFLESWEAKKVEWEKKMESIRKEVLDYVNSKVNKFSRISEVVEEKEEFVKTPTSKIKRYLYNSKDNKPENKDPKQTK